MNLQRGLFASVAKLRPNLKEVFLETSLCTPADDEVPELAKCCTSLLNVTLKVNISNAMSLARGTAFATMGRINNIPEGCTQDTAASTR